MELVFGMLNQGWLGTIVGLAGFVAAFVYYRKSHEGPVPMCLMESVRLIGRANRRLPEEVNITFGGRSVPRLTTTYVYFWNGGKRTILASQVVDDDPLRIAFSAGDEILRVLVVSQTRMVNKCAISSTPDRPHEAVLNFDFLDPGDGVKFEVLHTSELRFPALIGTIRGAPKGVRVIRSDSLFQEIELVARKFKHRNVLTGTMYVVGALFIVMGLLPFDWLSIVRSETKTFGDILVGGTYVYRFPAVAIGVAYAIVGVALHILSRRRYPSVLDDASG